MKLVKKREKGTYAPNKTCAVLLPIHYNCAENLHICKDVYMHVHVLKKIGLIVAENLLESTLIQ